MPDAATEFLTTIRRALGGEAKSDARVEFTGEGGTAMTPAVSVDRRLASFWLGFSVEPTGWSRPPVWDVIAGDYACADGWIRLHPNAAHHREAALAVLATASDREAVGAAVKSWQADELEAAVVARLERTEKSAPREHPVRPHPQVERDRGLHAAKRSTARPNGISPGSSPSVRIRSEHVHLFASVG
jgi:hypothetical protein